MTSLPSPTHVASLHLPVVDPGVQDEVLEELLVMLDELPGYRLDVATEHVDEARLIDASPHEQAFELSIPLLESCLNQEPADLDSRLLAQLAFMAQFPALPEQLALQVAFGRRVAEEHAYEVVRLVSRASRRGLTVDEYVAHLAATDSVPSTRTTRLFRGGARRVPDPRRIMQGIALLRYAAAAAPESIRPPLLCAIAWLLWARGKRAHALAYLSEASRIEPEHILAYGLTWLVTNDLPLWSRPGRRVSASIP